MTRGPMSVWISVQMSPDEKATLDAYVEECKRENLLTSRNRVIREWIKSLKRD